MSQPALEAYYDFDGVFNAFPERDILKRGGQNHMEWMKPGDERAELYDPDNNAFLLNGNKVLKVREGRYRIHWSNELSFRTRLLCGQTGMGFNWLTTWQPYTALLDNLLGFYDDGNVGAGRPISTKTEQWYDPDTREGIWTGKCDTITSRIRKSASDGSSLRLIWIDDEECDYINVKKVKDALDGNPDADIKVLMVRPDERIGISRRQFDRITEFAREPDGFDRLTVDTEPSIKDPVGMMRLNHLGF